MTKSMSARLRQLSSGRSTDKRCAKSETRAESRDLKFDPDAPVFTAWDLGYRDDTAIWWYQVVRGEIHVMDYYAVSGASIEEIANVVNSKGYRYTKHFLPHDARAKTLASGGKSILEQLASHLGGIGKLAIVPEIGVQDGIQAVRMILPSATLTRSVMRG
jgi:phage terminase large subunit